MTPHSRFMTLCIMAAVCTADAGADAPGWPQWRGPHRDGVSVVSELPQTWPAAGPKVEWRVAGGGGFSGIAVEGNRLYTMVSRDHAEYLLCLDAADGRQVWRLRMDDIFLDHQGGNGPRATPTIDGKQVYALGARGKLYAVGADDGKVVWEHDLMKMFGGEPPRWGFCSSPSVEGDLVLVETGGSPKTSVLDVFSEVEQDATIAAFRRDSGKIAWTAAAGKPSYSSPIAIDLAGRRQVIFFTSPGLIALDPSDGATLWSFPWETSYDVNAATPVFIPPNRIFISSGYDTGASVIQVDAAGSNLTAREIWKTRMMKNHFGSSVVQGDYLYGFDNAILKCLDARTGSERWKKRGFGKGTLLLAAGHLIVLGEQGNLGLVEATPESYREKSTAQILEGRCWTMPALAAGRLFLRNEEEIVCLNLTL